MEVYPLVNIQKTTMWPPRVIGWLTKAPVTIVISAINHSYWSYKRDIPSGYVKIAIENGPVEIVDFPSYNIAIFNSKLFVYQRVRFIAFHGIERTTFLGLIMSTVIQYLFVNPRNIMESGSWCVANHY